jgi:fucose 4-O-acetylase-like acetyltransferase
MKKRIIEIDKAKGLAILLVVFGHIVAHGGFPAGNNWMVIAHMLVYKFHMPFFMFLSGFVMFYSYKPITSRQEYLSYVKKRFIRLMPAYFLFCFIIYFGKLFFQNYMHVDNPIKSFIDIFRIFVYPMESFSVFLWYIYVLFLYYVTIPILLKIAKNNFTILLVFSLLLSTSIYFLPIPGIFAINAYCEYLFVFILGGVCGLNHTLFFNFIRKFGLIFLIIFIILLVIIPFYDLPKLLVGLFSIPALIYLVTIIPENRPLQLLGDYLFPIYLMNTIFIGLAKAIILKFCSWDNSNFYFIAPILLIAGIYIPIFIKKYLLRFIPVLNNIII